MPTASATSSSGDRGFVEFLRSLAPFLLVLALGLVMHFIVKPMLSPFYAKVLIDIGINVVLAVSLTIVNGFTGQFSMGHAAFMLVGGYVAATIVYYGSMMIWGDAMAYGGRVSGADEGLWFRPADVMFLGAILAGGIVAAGCGYLVGLPSLRLRGDYLAIVTLGFGEIVRVLVQNLTTDVLYTTEEISATPIYKLPLMVGGSLGFSGLPFYNSMFWVAVAVGATMAVSYRLKQSSYGRAFLSIREDEIAAEAMGVDTTRYKVRAFVLAAFFAGIAGGLFAHTVGVTLNPAELGFMKSFDIIIMVVLGGMGSISGAAIAATGLTILPELLRAPPHVWPAGLVVLVLAVVLSGGKRLKAAIWVVSITIALELIRYFALKKGINLADYRMILYALSLILIMILRPKGLLGVREVWDRQWWRSLVQAAHGRTRRRRSSS